MEPLSLSKELTTIVDKLLREEPEWLLTIPKVRTLLAIDRLQHAKRIRQYGTSLEESTEIHDHTLIHNMNGLKQHQALWRPSKLFYPLLAIEHVENHISEKKLLIIGPRSEAEIFIAWALGFNPNNITAVDLLSYSEYVDLGDMHDLPYHDDCFDVIVAGWVLAYSANNQKVANEIIRVGKPGAHVAIGCVAEPWSMVSEKQILEAVGGIMMTSDDPERPGKTKTVSRYFHTSQILRLFDKHIDSVILREDKHPSMLEERSNVITIFRLIA